MVWSPLFAYVRESAKQCVGLMVILLFQEGRNMKVAVASVLRAAE